MKIDIGFVSMNEHARSFSSPPHSHPRAHLKTLADGCTFEERCSLFDGRPYQEVPRLTAMRVLLVLSAILLIAILHFAVSTHTHSLHAIHVLLAVLSVIPILCAAIWFGLRGALAAAAVVCVIYVAHMRYSWADQLAENINQAGMVVVYLFIGATCGFLVDRRDRERTRRMEAERQMQRQAIVQGLASLAKALGSRDDATLRHSQQVAAVAVELGRRHGFGPDRLETLRLAALVHDVGKIGISDDILLKPGLLEPAEFQRMRRHPMIAAEILQTIRGTEAIAEIVLAHHERIDGSGYPRGLYDQEISQEAKILAVADVYCALLEKRAYKPPAEPEAVVLKIAPMAGRQLDSQTVALLGQMVAEGNIVTRSVTPGETADDGSINR